LNLGKATHCSIAFLVLSVASNAVQNAQSQAAANEDYDLLGYLSLALLYLCLGIGCLSATAIMGKIGVKKSLMLGGFCDTFWILSSLPAAFASELETESFFTQPGFIYTMAILSSILDGFGGSVQWVAQGKYISDCATEKTKGFYFSYFWTFYMSSQVFGNLIAAFILKYFSQSTFFMIMAAISFSSIFIFATLGKPVLQHRIQVDEEGNLLDQSNIELNEDADIYDSKPFKEEIKEVWDLLISKKMRLLLPQVFWTGMSLAIYTGLLVPLIYDTIPGDE
jgi:hypothetical protein